MNNSNYYSSSYFGFLVVGVTWPTMVFFNLVHMACKMDSTSLPHGSHVATKCTCMQTSMLSWHYDVAKTCHMLDYDWLLSISVFMTNSVKLGIKIVHSIKFYVLY